MIVHYDSIAALRADYLARGLDKGVAKDFATPWTNNESRNDTLRKTEFGDTTLVPKAEALLDKLETEIETPRRVWDRSPAGAFCCIPDVIAGLPTPMRRQVHVQDETSPITILVTTTSSAAISAKVLEQRGITILALVMALSRVRPVTLQQLTLLDGRDEGETILTAEINTHPLDLATACYVLTSAGYDRRLTHGIAYGINSYTGGWPRGFSYFSPETYYDRLKPKLSTDPSRCLIIGAARLGDELLTEPTVWLNKQIAHFTQEEDETNG
jgi:hypothetical protein